MKSTLTSVVLSAGLALALSGCAAGAAPSAEEANDTKPTQDQDQQQHLASTSLALEKAYDDQFVKGQVDPEALQPLIYDVLQSMPENVRPQAKEHIYDVISRGQKDATEMTPEQRAQLAAPVSADKLGPQQVEQIGAWGWGFPGFGGFGGLGWTGGWAGGGWAGGWGGGWAGGWAGGWGGGWATTSTFASTTSTVGFGIPFGGFGWAGGWGGLGWAGGWGGLGWAGGWGGLGAFGLGFGGLGFGGLGAFGFPGCGFGFGGFGF